MHTFYQNRDHSFVCSISTNLTYPAHLHKHFELMYVLSGTMTVTINEESRALLPGDIAISFPNTIHSLKTTENSKIILLIFDSYLTEPSFVNLNTRKPASPFVTGDNLHKDVPYCMHALLDISKPYEANLDSALTKGYLTILLCRLLESLTLRESHSDDLNLVHQVLVYIDNHFTEALSLEQIAAKLKTSKFYLSRIFNHQLNTSFNLYLNNQRIQLAQNLLVSTDLSITEISFRSGFESMRTFYRAFKSICHLTPTRYRELHQKK